MKNNTKTPTMKTVEKPIAAIASFAVLKALNDSKKYKSPYQLLSNFIGYIICKEQLYTFVLSEMKNKLQDHFGFKVPEAVIKTSLRSLQYIKKANNTYYIDKSMYSSGDQFIDMKNDTESKYGIIVDRLLEWVHKSYPDADRHQILKAVVSYLIDDSNNSEFNDAISTFILANKGDQELQAFLNSVREGGILYLGINRNIGEWGSLTQPLTLYLDTEILFDLVGYNGSVYKELASDFHQLVKNGNRKGKIILRYFKDVKLEIERFFKSAERIVEGGGLFREEKPAMKQILNGCRTSADVRVKSADFFEALRALGVIQDENNDNYYEELSGYNIEYADCVSDRDREGWKAISQINKLRRGRISDFELESRFLIISDSRNVLDASDVRHEIDKQVHSTSNCAQYAVSLNRIVNLLWYKLDGGFGGEKVPSNAFVLIKAQIVLSKIIAKRASEIYQDSLTKYKNGEINQEQLGARILALREKPSLPEEIRTDNCETALDFSPETIAHLEVEIQSHRQYRSEQEKLVQTIQAENQKILADKAAEIKSKDEIITKQNNELLVFKQKEDARKKRNQNLVRWAQRIALVLFFVVVEYFAKFRWKNLDAWIQGIIDVSVLIGLYCSLNQYICSIIKRKVNEKESN